MSPTPAQQLIAMASGARVSQMIHGAAELGLADQLAAGAREVEELAAACGADPDSLVRLLRGLASLGVFEETAPRRFALTPMAALLRGDHPGSLRQFVRRLGEEHHQSWDDQLYCVRRGESAFRQEFWLAVLLVPSAFWLGRTWVEVALLAGSVLLVLIVELLNTGIEVVVDRIGTERNHLSGFAKDLGSTAVFVSLALLGITWGLVLLT
jgi:diacylglycerol kinase (ATP)